MCTAGTGASLSWGTPSHRHTPPRRAPEGAEGTEGMHESRLTMVGAQEPDGQGSGPGPTIPYLCDLGLDVPI